MTQDFCSTKFTLGPFHYRCIKSHESGIQLWEVTSAYNNPNDPGCGYSVTERPALNFEFPKNSLANHAFSRHELSAAEKLFDLLVVTPPQFRMGFGKGYVEEIRRPAYRIPNQFC
jgi:hypothetical protein